ncbi:Dynein heavy chain, cytoplasmic [Candida viswanathii]|uniref:Dynein heavy chain, cytoplasmic n=1 Tax=Candida viswanathii TaxID=5486 RepID=A0A367XWK0_9ASCO|nr:Dynein heavy chain, cytoplasmic [Candida viswanathii]
MDGHPPNSLLTADQLHSFITSFVFSTAESPSLTKPDEVVLEKFISNLQQDTLFVVQTNSNEQGLLKISNDISEFDSLYQELSIFVIIIKSKGQLTQEVLLTRQLNIINIPISKDDDNDEINDLFEKLRLAINMGLAPYFDLISATHEDSGLMVTKKKFNELSLALQHLQQRIHIPDLLIATHPRIKHLIENNKTDNCDDLIEDTALLNELTSIANNWIRQIQSITRLTHEPSDGGSITEDIHFWKSMDSALISLNQQIASPEVRLTREVLSKAKRFHITLGFENDTGLNEKLSETRLYNSFLKELPINDLITITDDGDLGKFDAALGSIFSHLKLKLNLLPLERAVKSVEVILNDIVLKFQELLGTHDVMSLSQDQFEQLYDLCQKELAMIEANIKYVINLLRELLRKRQEKFKIITIDQSKFEQIRERLDHLKQFRINHQHLLSSIESVLPLDEKLDSISRLNEAYNKHIITINSVDVTHQGKLIWSMNEQAYLHVFHELNTLVIKRINNFFNSASAFIDVISIYKRFFQSKSANTLLLLISDEHKLKILSLADREILELVDMNSSYAKKSAFDTIKWKIQASNKLIFYREFLRSLLGDNWKNYSMGTKIDTTTNKLISSLEPSTAIQIWIDNEVKQNLPTYNMDAVVKINESSSGQFDLVVNFNFKFFDIYRQLNQLHHLGYSIPSSVLLEFLKINQLYPIATGIYDHIQLLSKIFSRDLNSAHGESFGFLVEAQIKKVDATLRDVRDVEWLHLLQAAELQKLDDPLLKSSNNLVEFQSLEKLTAFQEAITQLHVQLLKLENFEKAMQHSRFLLRTATFDFASIENELKLLQQHFNNISLEDVENIDELANLINNEVAIILSNRLQTQLLIFNAKVLDCIEKDEIEVAELNSYKLEFALFRHNLVFQEESFIIEPALSQGKQAALQEVNQLVSVVENQQIIKPITLAAKKFSSILDVEETGIELNKAVEEVEELYLDAEEYITQWNLLQNLWELNLDDADDFAKIFEPEQDVTSWFTTVDEILSYRKVYDQPEPVKKFGRLFQIDFVKVQNRVALKFDGFQKELLNKFAEKAQSEFAAFNRSLANAKSTLEVPVHFHGTVESLISNIDNYLKFNTSIESWEASLVTYSRMQSFLMRYRFKFPVDWLYVEQLENNISMVRILLQKKKQIIDENLEILDSKVKSETAKINDSIASLSKDWQTKKPIGGNLNPALAMVDLDNFQKRFGKLHAYVESVHNISEHFSISIPPFEDTAVALDEIKDLRTVWSSVNVLWEELERLKQVKWDELQPRKLHHQLDDLLNLTRNLPISVRQYAAVDEIQSSVKSYLKNHLKLAELKNDAMKPRHWKILLSQLGIPGIPYEKLTVGDVWNLNFTLNIQTISAILEQAGNERTIEENLNNINASWSSITFLLFNYENKCRLVKNWELLFDQCSQDMNALTSMKNTPYFASFEREISELEKKLNQLFVILDTWIEVQRQWLYLEGVFGNENNDIKNLLPIESSRFTNISYEFLTLLKRIYKFNLVIDIVLIGDLQSKMSKFSESLTKVRKSLTEYLEKQRELFPRFYFIGNEDLLEIMGGTNDISRINNHLKKMFGGIQSLQYANESSSITGAVSEEGEILTLRNPVSLIKNTRLNEWLRELELEVKLSMSHMVKVSLQSWQERTFKKDEDLLGLIDSMPAQVATLLQQISFTKVVDESMNLLATFYDDLCRLIQSLTRIIGSEILELTRRKVQYLIIEIIHQRDIVQKIEQASSESEKKFVWSLQQKFYYNTSETDSLKSLVIRQANSEFIYGFEYLGIPEKLAYTPLTDDCYLAMGQAIALKQGGSPFGPAGTGKTESVKALGHNLGKMVIVFCCDESFDFQSMGRIFLGLCKVGIWGCFDEFNRLDDKSLSAISSQIENIEYGLKNPSTEISVSERNIKINPETGIFITMNPGYAGRVELPENLKKLFRSFSMESPDSEIIVEILLTSQTFEHSKELANVIVPFFRELAQETSLQLHYDFGLRALKNALVRCGQAKRKMGNANEQDMKALEYKLVLQSIIETTLPKLVREDESTFDALKNKYFSNVISGTIDKSTLTLELEKYYKEHGIFYDEKFIRKALQLVDIQETHHGIMLVGESGSGKSTILDLVMHSLSVVENVEHTSVRIDAKVLSKDEIYGKLDLITRDWADGLFTSVLRRVKENLRGELTKRIWIVFDGDIDPQWAENLNSVLDDNKILTLPNGERLALPENVRIVFEVDNLKYATPATITRCGIVWFDVSLIPVDAHIHRLIYQLKNFQIASDDSITESVKVSSLKHAFVDHLDAILSAELLSNVCEIAQQFEHIMDFSLQRAIRSFEISLKTYLRRLITYATSEEESDIDVKKYTIMSLLLAVVLTFAGDSPHDSRLEFEKALIGGGVIQGVHLPSGSIFDHYISLPDCDWLDWNNKVAAIELEPHQVSNPSTIVPTLDTVKHENLVYSILNEHSPLLLCGPPGSGKTMTLFEALRKSPQLELLSLNFSKETSPLSLLKSLDQYCEYRKTNRGMQLTPRINGKWVVVFCDEINLPQVDKYGNQNVISLIRQMVEHNGFWRVKDNQWVTLENIQFVGACNSPKDPGRNRLSERFLRHVPVIMVDYPGHTSMLQIYQTFNRAILKCAPDLRGFAKAITEASIQVYEKTRQKFDGTIQKHYVYSPRELTRWSRGLLEALKSTEYKDLHSFVRLWYHEGLRLFYDRLVSEDEKQWTLVLFREVSQQYFPNVDLDSCFKEPIFFSNWMSLNYKSVDEKELRSFVAQRLRVFSEEEMEVDLVLHDEMLDHALRIDRVLRQPQGHMILVGLSASGKSTLAKFVAWINGLKVVFLNVRTNYTIENFDATLRDVLTRCVQGEKICFIIDESSILEASFIERMNTLLANAEIPGLFEGDDYTVLMNKCLEISHSQGLLLDTETELYNWFAQQISQNLHVVFSISDSTESNSQSVISSPALFNRCVLSWMGDWSDKCLYEIASARIGVLPVDISNFAVPTSYSPFLRRSVSSLRDVIVDVLGYIHRFVPDYKSTMRYERTPNDFLNLVHVFAKLFTMKQQELEDNQRHITVGLDKLRETVIQVDKLKNELAQKEETLKLKDKEAKQMLNKLLTDQNEAERKQEFSIDAQAELEKQEAEIQRRKEIVMRDLEYAEPAVLEAQRGVQNIKKQHLSEIRSMANPPAAVKMTMESVCILLGYNVSSWRDVQLVIRKDDFIPNIVSFNGEDQLSVDLREYMEKVYLSREDYTFELVHRASKACGPLLQWVQAQLNYSRILQSVGPLREEVQILEQQTLKTKAQLIAVDEMIFELEESIEKYKENYSELIRETENIKREMASVHKKVDRSMALIKNLTKERGRWKESVTTFGSKRDKLVGESVLVAAFIAYGGLYDQKGRELLLRSWKSKLKDAAVPFDESLTLGNYLASSREILHWVNAGLVNDSLNIENFALLKWSENPVIIDPSATIVDTLAKSASTKSVTVTSFLHDGLLNQLENALRFGGLMVIQDCEHYDPIVDNILRKEIHRNGGRMMIKLGDQIIDYSSDFKLILCSKESNLVLPPSVSSRTTVVNFTVTSGSLENRAMDFALQEVRPDVEQQRAELVVLNGEWKLRLQALEEELLDSLGTSAGELLDNDSVMQTLETLKTETDGLNEKLAHSVEVMNHVEETRGKYQDVSKCLSTIYSILESLGGINHFYNFSLSRVIKNFSVLLKRNISSSPSELIVNLYKDSFARVATSLQYQDKIVFALVLTTAFYVENIGDMFKSVFTKLLSLIRLEDGFETSVNGVFDTCLARREDGWDVAKIIEMNQDNLTLQVLSDLLLAAGDKERKQEFVDSFGKISSVLFDDDVPYTSPYDLAYWVEESNVDAVILTCPDVFDASYKVEQIANQLGKKLTIVSMGSKEGIEIANKELERASVSPKWILIQNIQMSPSWLSQLENKLSNLHSASRVFLTCKNNSKVPIGLISRCKVLNFENEVGIRQIVWETYQGVSMLGKDKLEKHVILLLIWYHSVLVEGLRYVPVSYKKKYDFNDSDFACGVTVVEKIFANYDGKPESIGWEEIRYLIAVITYGGKVDNHEDLEFMKKLAEDIFTAKSFDQDFNLIANEFTKETNDVLQLPDSHDDVESWINSLPYETPLSWIYLPNNANSLVKKQMGLEIVEKVIEIAEDL